MKSDFVPSEMTTRASAALEKEVERELSQPDPSPAKARAAIQDPKNQSSATQNNSKKDKCGNGSCGCQE